MNAVARWVRLDLRRRARSLAVVALLVALSSAIVLTALAGARRGASAVDRLIDRTEPATLAVLPNEPGFDWDTVAQLPGVEAIARFPVFPFQLEGFPEDGPTDFAWIDPSIMDTIERPVVLEGRLADPTRADEAVVTGGFEGFYGVGVGDTVTIRLYSPEQADGRGLGLEGTEPEGPRVEARIVGAVRSPWFSEEADRPGGRLVPSPGLFAAHETSLVGSGSEISVNALVRLRDGAAGVPAFRERLAEASGRSDIEFLHLADMAQHARDVATFEARSLLAFAVASAAAALFLVGQSVARYVSGAVTDLEVLRAFGMTRRHVRIAATAGPVLAAVAGAAVGVAATYPLSSRFPLGTASLLEPTVGRQWDLTVVVPGLLGVTGLVVAGSLVAAWRATRGAGTRRRSAVAAAAARSGAPVPVAVGVRFALEPGNGSQAVPVRPALVGSVVGVLGVVAALTFAEGVRDASENPDRFGQVFEIQSFFGFNDEDYLPVDEVLRTAAADPDVDAVNDTRHAVATAGSTDVSVFSFEPVDDPLDVVVTQGRLPARQDEITLAPATAAATGAGPGDRVELTGTRRTATYAVSGIAFVPTGAHNDYDTGAWLPPEAYDELFDGFKFHTADIALRPGADPDVVASRLGESVAASLGQPDLAATLFSVRQPPSRLAELEQVRRLPLFLAGFLGVLALGAVGHALATAVRRRRHDIAVLRALGLSRWQCRGIVLAQASVLAAIGLLAGVPLGVALGRTLWRSVADSTPLAYVAPVTLWLLVLIGPVVLLLVNALAAWPSQRAATTRVGHVLRTE
jgi:ABC-type lipoprotein release transport system permease subunit